MDIPTKIVIVIGVTFITIVLTNYFKNLESRIGNLEDKFEDDDYSVPLDVAMKIKEEKERK